MSRMDCVMPRTCPVAALNEEPKLLSKDAPRANDTPNSRAILILRNAVGGLNISGELRRGHISDVRTRPVAEASELQHARSQSSKLFSGIPSVSGVIVGSSPSGAFSSFRASRNAV